MGERGSGSRHGSVRGGKHSALVARDGTACVSAGAAVADETTLEIAVCHFPPGASKWNKIEHRRFSAISAGRDTTPVEVAVCGSDVCSGTAKVAVPQ
jgi:Rhodopirellula transposase DDE domain